MSAELRISGMTCAACARTVERALRAAGASDIDVDWRSGRAIVEPNGAGAADLARALEGTRYRIQCVGEPKTAMPVDAGEFECDLAVIGSGGGAFAAATAAREEIAAVREPVAAGAPRMEES
jgi:mercuric reductase